MNAKLRIKPIKIYENRKLHSFLLKWVENCPDLSWMVKIKYFP